MSTVNPTSVQQQQGPFGTPAPESPAPARVAVDDMVEAGLFDDLMKRFDFRCLTTRCPRNG